MSILTTSDLSPFDSTSQLEHNESFLVNDFLLYDNEDSFAAEDSFQLHTDCMNHCELVDQLPSETKLTIENVFSTPYTPCIDTFDPVSLLSTPFTPAIGCFNDITIPYSPDLCYEGGIPLFSTPYIPSLNDFDLSMSNITSVDTPLTLSLDGFDTKPLSADPNSYGMSGLFAPVPMLDTPFLEDVNEFGMGTLSSTPIHPSLDTFSPDMLNATPNLFSEGIDLTPFLTPATDFECDNFSAPGTPVDPATINAINNINYLQFGNEAGLYNEICKVDKNPQSFSLFAPLEEIAKSHQESESSTSNSPDSDIFTAPAPQESSKSRLAAAKSKKYICSHQGCNKSFARKFNLNVHVRSHYPELARPFKCSECPKAFGRKHDLTRHLAAVHKATSLYHCGECEKEFSRRDALARHLEKGCQLV